MLRMPGDSAVPEKIQLHVKRQDTPASSPYWEDYEIPYQPRQNVVSVLMEIAKDPKTRALASAVRCILVERRKLRPKDFFLAGKPKHLRQSRIHFRNTVISRG